MLGNVAGSQNVALGSATLAGNGSGSFNTATGFEALINVDGSSNVAVGAYSGANLFSGSANIYIGSPGGAGTESGTIRIGQMPSAPQSIISATQTATYIAGIYGSNVTGGAAVVVDASGRLGVASSSRRYKEDVTAMGTVSERLYDLRPVSFRYRAPDAAGGKPLQFGLIAEDVAATFPELTVYNQDGEPETVAYHVLPALLLNELQKQHRELAQAREQLEAQAEQLRALHARLGEVDQLRADLAEVRALTRRLAAAQGADRPALAAATPVSTERASAVASAP